MLCILKYLRAYFQGNLKPLVGVDIGSAMVKIVALSRATCGEYMVESYHVEPVSGDLMAWKLKNMDAEVVIGLPTAAAFARVIQMNGTLTMDEIAEQIEIEAHRLIPYPLEEVYYDFEVMGPNRTQAELLDILFVASKIDTVKAHIKPLENAGLAVRVVDLESLAMERAFKWLAYLLPEHGVQQRIALFDIGARISCHVFYNLKSVYSRDQTFDAHQPIGAQIQRALQQFSAAHVETDLQLIVLSGGVVVDAVLLENELKIKTVIANPFFGMVCAPGICAETLYGQAQRFMLSFGLALRNFDV